MKVTDVTAKIKPYVLGWMSEAGGGDGPYAPTPHDLNSGHHTGDLDPSQFTAALLRDGSRSVTGNLPVAAGVTLDGVDLSAFKSDYDTHVGATARVGHNGIGEHTHQTVAEGGTLDHNAALTNIGADDHHAALVQLYGDTGSAAPNATNGITIASGDGIITAATGSTVTVTAAIGGTPTTIEPDDTESAGTSSYSTRADHQHAIVTTAPTADSVNVAPSSEGTATAFARSDHTHNLDEAIAPTWTGHHLWATNHEIRFRDSDLRIYSGADGQLDVDADVEVEISAPTVHLAVSTRAFVEGALDVDGDLEFQGAQQITTTVDALTMSPAGNLLLSPGGDVLTTDTVASDHWVSGLNGTGWGISYAGHGDFRSMYSEEIRTHAFIAEIYSAMAGALVITQSRARVSRDFTIPDTGSTATLYVEDLEGFEDVQVFTSGDYVLLRVMNRGTSGQGLVVENVYGTVSAYADLANGEQSWTFTTTTTGYSAGDTIYAGSIVLDYGQMGSGSRGVWSATVLDAAGAPYSQIQTWDTITNGEPSNFTAHVRTGNLDGLAGVGLEYGLYAGQGLTDSDTYVLITDQQAELHNIPLTLHDGANTVFKIDPDTPSLALGATIPTAYDTGDGVWMGLDGGYYKARIGDADGDRLEYDGQNVRLYGSLIVGTGIGYVVDDAVLYLPFDGPRPYATDFQVNTTGHLGQAATVSGGVIGRPGKFGKAVQIAEATTNLWANNPVFGAASLGGAAWGTPTVSEKSSTNSLYGEYSYRVVTDASYEGLALTSFGFSGSTTYTFSVWVYVMSGSADALVRNTDGSNVAVIGSTSTEGEWVRLVAQYTTSVGQTGCQVILRGASSGSELYFDAVQAEESSYATPFAYGDMPNHSWSGTPHASTSSRTAARFNLNEYAGELIQTQGTVFGWWVVDTVPSDSDLVYIFDCRNASATGSEGIVISMHTDDRFDVWLNGSSYITDVGSGSLSRGDEVFWCLTWDYDADEYTFIVYQDGTKYTGSSTASITLPAITDVALGTKYDGSFRWLNGILDDVCFLNCAMPADDIAAIYESDAPITVNTNVFELYLTAQDHGLIRGHAGGLFATDADGNVTFAIANEDGVSWDGGTLNTADVQIGRNAGNYIKWDASTGTLDVKGSITLTNTITSSEISDVASFDGTAATITDVASGADVTADNPQAVAWLTDAGALATADDLDDVPNGSTYSRVLATDISAGHIKLTSATVVDGEWYDSSGVEIDASSGINIYGTDNALTTRATKTGTIQCSVNASGQIVAGGGAVRLDGDAIKLDVGSSSSDAYLKWFNGATEIATAYTYAFSGGYELGLTVIDQDSVIAFDVGGYNILNLAGPNGYSYFQYDVRVDGFVGLGTTGTRALDVYDSDNGDFVAKFQNDGNGSGYYGIVVTCGADDGSQSYIMRAEDGNGTDHGGIEISGGTVQIYQSSDARLKTNIRESRITLEDVLNLRVSDFEWQGGKSGSPTGFVAQDNMNIIPGFVGRDTDGMYTVRPMALIPAIVKALQDLTIEQRGEIESLRRQIAALEANGGGGV